ncbi:centrosomal protein of 120 kDa-like [Tubulanus polymorphus]|uniref:centrosomal protein of 120 kDa-like n=1 Tax=Tubulanus polymorphus TaxID=672921 RepID=UPI003DA47BDC
MPIKERFLVVVAVLEGRKFPRRPKHKLIAEARFDGELLATDPVEHSENPDFTQEIAWELDKKGLSQHRLQRSSIKVQYYAVDTQSTMREPVGYVMLDLRSASNVQTAKWYPLLHGKYSRSKPEVRIGIYIDDDSNTEQQGFKARNAPGRIGQAPTSGAASLQNIDVQLLKPVLIEEEGYYQIGPDDSCSELFCLSVTIAFASNLTQLVPSSQPLPAGPGGFFFYYSLLGNDVTIEPFYDLLDAKFAAERSTVRVRSSLDVLRAFLEKQPGLQVHLCCGDQSLGSTNISLNQLLKKDSTEIYMRPVLIESIFELLAPARVRSQMAPIAPDTAPSVGISIMLRKEEQEYCMVLKDQGILTLLEKSVNLNFWCLFLAGFKWHVEPRKEKPSPLRIFYDLIAVSPPSPSKQEADQATAVAGATEEKKKSPPKPTDEKKQKSKTKTTESKPQPAPTTKPRTDDDYTEDFISEKTEENVPSIREEQKKQTPEKTVHVVPAAALPPSSPVLPTLHSVVHDAVSQSSATQHHVSIPPQAHHFNFSIDLRLISNLDSNVPLNVYTRYVYPFFGSSAPVMTSPPVEVRKGMQVALPQSFCAFDFATTVKQLEDTFRTLPLVVEVWDRDRQKSQDFMIGLCQLPLQSVLTADKSRVQQPNSSIGWRQAFSSLVPVNAKSGAQKKIADLFVTLNLEDKGSVQTQQVTYPSESLTLSEEIAKPTEPTVTEQRETAEYQAAMELEMWKELQENMFENKLKEKEFQHMKTLAEEWKRRDRERELLVKKKVAEYTQLEEHLKRTIADFEKRQKALTDGEQEVSKHRSDLERQHERKILETREASRRMKEDCDHQIEIEKMKNRELQEVINKCKTQLEDAERKNQNLDREFQLYKEQQNTKPEVRLQSEINLLTLEKVELERKLDAITKSKVHYKQQWGRALKELARLKQKEQEHAKALLRKQHQELEHMRLRYLAAEEKEVVKSEMKELEDIKNEINKLKEQEEKRSKSVSPESDEMELLKPDLDASFDDHIARLIEERDALLRTGVYTNEDRIISELDRQIREAIQTNKADA